MQPIDLCTNCGGRVEEKEVEKYLGEPDRGLLFKCNALVCESCDERYYSWETALKIEELRAKLKGKQGDKQDGITGGVHKHHPGSQGLF